MALTARAKSAMGDFPLLQRVVNEVCSTRPADYENEQEKLLLHSLRPQEVDGLAREFGNVFEIVVKSSLHQSFIPTHNQFQKELCEHLMSMVYIIVAQLPFIRQWNDNFLAVITLLIKTTATSTNLKALLRIMEADDMRAGSIRCNAIIIMNGIVGRVDICIWSMKLGSDGQEQFSTEYLKVLGKILHDEATRGDCILHTYSDDVQDKRCKCLCMESGVWENTFRALQMTKDDPFTIINILDTFDWTSILESDEAPKSYDMHIAHLLTTHATNVLLIDKNDSKARSLYRKVGRSQKLFHRVLKKIITAEIYSLPPEKSDPRRILTDLGALSNYVHNCVMLAPASSCIDNTTNRLVDCAQSTLQRVFNMRKIQNFLRDSSQLLPSKNNIVLILSSLTSRDLALDAALLEEDRIEYIIENNCQDDVTKKMRKETRKINREAKEAGDIKVFDMCANCFVTDTDLKKEEKALLKCTSCKQVTYVYRFYNCTIIIINSNIIITITIL